MSTIAAIGLNPVRLAVFVGWMYLCLYLTQRVQFSGMFHKKIKPLMQILSLFAGPIVFLTAAITEIARDYAISSAGLVEIIVAKAKKIGQMRTMLTHSRNINLMDTSGRNIKEIYGHGSTGGSDKILNTTETIIMDAIEANATDILIDPQGNSQFTVRVRVDGVLTTATKMHSRIGQAVVNSIKAVSNMDIAEHRRPQDGAFQARLSDRAMSFRVASAGAVNGEKLSIRVLNSSAGQYDLQKVGLSSKQIHTVEKFISAPSGMILLCGPTGSGKTTTLYAMLNSMDRFTRNIITVEDPIEYVLADTSQIEINPKADITFAKTLRSILRQDPDVICVGEIRDEETAQIALRASQTGHLVLATIHSNSNAGAIVRLLDLGVSPLLISSGISLLVSQRLIRLLCPKCKIPQQLNAAEKEKYYHQKINYTGFHEPLGCKNCNQTGYLGRTGIFDLLIMTDKLKAGISTDTDFVGHMREHGEQRGRSNLRKQAMKKVVTGLSSMEEIKRVIG